jgi:hypothetical protein
MDDTFDESQVDLYSTTLFSLARFTAMLDSFRKSGENKLTSNFCLLYAAANKKLLFWQACFYTEIRSTLLLLVRYKCACLNERYGPVSMTDYNCR